jgi:hypothetical protein
MRLPARNRNVVLEAAKISGHLFSTEVVCFLSHPIP